MRALALALLVAFPVSASERTVFQVREGSITTVSGELVPVTGGAYLPPETLLATGKELASLRAENAALKEAPEAPPTAFIVVAAVALAVGFAGGVVLAVKLR